MKLLAPNVGWALSMRELLWTSSGGTSWKDITPPAPKGAVISGIFFLDTNRGWVLLAHGEPDVPGGLQFDLASTDNAGTTWSIRHVTLPERKYSESDILNGGFLAFADSLHGWLALRAGMSAAFHGVGVLLTTSDGGGTWKLATAGGWEKYDTIGPMLMLTPEQGWLVGGGANELLRATRDGGRTWQTVELEPPGETEQMREYKSRLQSFESSFRRSSPSGVSESAIASPRYSPAAWYALPTFKDRKHGYLCVRYPRVTVLFATNDGGDNWRPDGVLEGPPTGPSAVVDSTWITAKVSQNGLPRLGNVASGDATAPSTPPDRQDRPAHQISFATPSQGWVLTSSFKLLSTNDGGASWTDITPSRRPRAATP